MVKSVIVVDDNPGVRKLLCEAFTIAGDFSICGEAANGTDRILVKKASVENLQYWKAKNLIRVVVDVSGEITFKHGSADAPTRGRRQRAERAAAAGARGDRAALRAAGR